MGVGDPKGWVAHRALGCTVRAKASILGGYDGAQWIQMSGWKDADKLQGQEDRSSTENRKRTGQLPCIIHFPGHLGVDWISFKWSSWNLPGSSLCKALFLIYLKRVSCSLNSQPTDEEMETVKCEVT